MSAATPLTLADALKAVLPFAESRAEDLSECANEPATKCSRGAGLCTGHDNEAKANAAKAWEAVTSAQAALRAVGKLP